MTALAALAEVGLTSERLFAPNARSTFFRPSLGIDLTGRRNETAVKSSDAISASQPGSDAVAHVLRGGRSTVKRSVYQADSLAQRLFDARVELKMATARYAMHLSQEARDRLFAEFDYLLEEETWDPSDRLPSAYSYQSFLKWLIYTSDCSWSSLGISDDGTIMAAWVRGQNRLTADFGDKIRWSQAVLAEGEIQTSAGRFSLEHFAKRAKEFLASVVV